ncbi:MAG: hypothetical protein NW202_12270 [Nitrospira sp.]|nr:hypothetical protein [Nitrospira sp.]
MRKRWGSLSCGLIVVGVLAGWAVPGHAMTVTTLDITEGSVNYKGRFQHVLNRLLDQGGVVKMGEYQPIGEIVPSITKGRATFSIFTAGFNGAPPPSATVDGSSIAADLSSLFFAVSRGDSIRLWNIGGQAAGTFDPETSQFTLSWKDQVPSVFGSRSVWEHFLGKGDGKERWDGNGVWRHVRSREATFILEGTAIVGGAPTPVPIPASLALYATGLLALVSWGWFTRQRVGVV